MCAMLGKDQAGLCMVNTSGSNKPTLPGLPGLGKTPAAFAIDIDENGETVGLF